MFRNVLYAVALGGVLAAAHPVFADPLASAAAEHAQAASATKQTASTAHALPSTSTVTAPARNQSQEDAPVGFGWG
jgi:hypothetical protein